MGEVEKGHGWRTKRRCRNIIFEGDRKTHASIPMTETKEHKGGGQTEQGRLIQMFTGEEKIIFGENLERFKSQRFSLYSLCPPGSLSCIRKTC